MLKLPSPALIGVIHLPPLPGSPLHQLAMDEIVGRALADGRALTDAHFDAAIIENFGDAPFFPTSIPPATVGAMAIIADRVRRDVGITVGINALRNDGKAAIGIAAAASAALVRVNIHTGVYATDQGIIAGEAAETLRYRKLLGVRVAILADVHVKHATPMGDGDIAQAAKDTAYRGLADGLIVTGSATGEAVDVEDLRRVRSAVPDRRVFVGSGATAASIAALLHESSGVIVGSGIKIDGDIARAIDPSLAREFARAAGRS